MKKELKSLPKSQIELSIELSSSDMEPYLDLAARAISTQNQIKGFRPGFAPRDVVAREFGEEKLDKAASEIAIGESIKKAVAENNLDAIGDPKVSEVKCEG